MIRQSFHLGLAATLLIAGAGLSQGAIINLNAQVYVGGTNSLYQSAYNYNAYPNDIPNYTPTGSSQANACTPATLCTLNTNLGTRDNTGTATSGLRIGRDYQRHAAG